MMIVAAFALLLVAAPLGARGRSAGASGAAIPSCEGPQRTTSMPLNIVKSEIDTLPKSVRDAQDQALRDSLLSHPPVRPVTFSVTVALVDRLSDATAGAEVVRRASETPSDLMLLLAANPTAGAYSAALRELGNLYRGSIGAASQDQQVAIKSVRIREGLDGLLDSNTVFVASHNPSVLVRGIVTVRACQITAAVRPMPSE